MQLDKWPGWDLNQELSNCKAHVASVALGTWPKGQEQTIIGGCSRGWSHWEVKGTGLCSLGQTCGQQAVSPNCAGLLLGPVQLIPSENSP